MSTVLLQTAVDEETFAQASARANEENKSLDAVLADRVKRYAKAQSRQGAKTRKGARGKKSAKENVPAPVFLAPRHAFGLTETAEAPAATQVPAFQMYVVKAGDTLSGISKLFYGDPNRFALIAQANNITDFRRIFPGQELKIPTLTPTPTLTRPTVEGTTPAQPQPVITTPTRDTSGLRPGPFPDYPPIPDGLAQIKQVFGEFTYIDSSNLPGNVTPTGNWERENIILQRDVPTLPNHRILCHKLLAQIFVNVLTEIQNAGLAGLIRSYDGCYNPRHKLHDPRKDLSAHSWGIALDVNASTNQVGTRGDMDPRIIDIFATHGFYWGGNFGDPMHFQYCTSY